MKKFDGILFGAAIGAVFPVFFSLLLVTLWFYFDRNESNALIYLIVGLILGFIVDVKYLRKWIKNKYNLSNRFIIAIIIFYNICMYGFFMGFPVFNLSLSLIAGYYLGKKICCNKIPIIHHGRIINQVSTFAGFIMTLICISSGIIALNDKFTGKSLSLMFGLDYEITQTIILLITVIGGICLVFFQYYITRFTIIKTIKSNGC
jgi:hypothetical protein